MLASTVQFSKYGESLHIPHRQPRHNSKEHTGRYDEHEALQEETVARSLRTQQRAYNQLPTTTAFHTLPHASVRSTSRTRRDLQVSRRTGPRSTRAASAPAQA